MQQEQEKKIKENRKTKIQTKTTCKNEETKSLCQKKKAMLTKKHWLVLFVSKLRKRVKEILLFVEYAQCGSMETVMLMKPTFYANSFRPKV